MEGHEAACVHKNGLPRRELLLNWSPPSGNPAQTRPLNPLKQESLPTEESRAQASRHLARHPNIPHGAKVRVRLAVDLISQRREVQGQYPIDHLRGKGDIFGPIALVTIGVHEEGLSREESRHCGDDTTSRPLGLGLHLATHVKQRPGLRLDAAVLGQ